MNKWLTRDAISFLQELHHTFDFRRRELLSNRPQALARALAESNLQREWIPNRRSSPAGEWKVAAIPPALRVRTVEITGPAEPKMIINALNCGASAFMADFEDSLSPTWHAIMTGHSAIQEALRRTLVFKSDDGSKSYQLKTDETQLATLLIRPRGWHLPEKAFQIDGRAMSGSLFDFGLSLFHGGKIGIETGRGPFYYLPKLESALEAKLWADVFKWSETKLDLARGSIRATMLIETLPGALAMEEILFELRDYAAGLNAGRWDYLFSMIKSLAGTDREINFPDRRLLNMETPFMRRYAERIVEVCHRHGAYAMGGMSALIPSRKDPELNARAFELVRKDKEREARQGFNGTWVAHPDLVPIAMEAFRAATPVQTTANSHSQIGRLGDLIPQAQEKPFIDDSGAPVAPTLAGAILNIDVSLRYISHWLGGLGAVAIHGLMEDAATAEISRMQLWQWRKNAVRLDTGETVTADWLITSIRRTASDLGQHLNNDPNSLSIAASDLFRAEDLLKELVLQETYAPFLTLPAMDRLQQKTQETQHGFDRAARHEV